MILNVLRQVHDQVAAAVRTEYGIAEVPTFAIEVPPDRAMGDLAVTVAFQLARSLRKAPRAIAQELKTALGSVPGIARVDAAPNGYLNLSLDRRAFLLARLRGETSAATGGLPVEKTIVEHTAINPNKAAHIGHLRNATLGDTLVRALRFGATPVEVQNYIDDLGVQVADIIVGFAEIERKTLPEIRAIADSTRFDYYCWDLYSRVTEWYGGQPDRLAVRARALHDLEVGASETAAIGAFVADRIVRCHLKTMARLNIGYDLLTHEGDILRLQFWAHAFEILKAQGAVFLQTEGKLAGCWVMRIDEGEPDADDNAGEGGESAREKVIVRSNGVVTYVGKDIAYQFWKLGLLGRDFRYRVFANRPHGVLWATSSQNGSADHPAYGGASYVYNVIDVRQSYLQKLLKQALIAVGHPEGAERSHHFSYEMVALSHATARELGFAPPPDSEEAKRPFVEVSGRKGLGVKADDLLDAVIHKAGEEVGKRNPELSADEVKRTAQMIGIAAVRYFLIKFSRGKVIAFDLEEALSFEGETGPYIQYAIVRANKIFQKLQERDGLDEAAIVGSLPQVGSGELTGEHGGHELWDLVLAAARLDEVVEQVARTLEFSVLAKYAFSLAQSFNAFYNLHPSRSSILNEERDAVRRWRAAGVIYVRNQLTRALDLMGVAVPLRM